MNPLATLHKPQSKEISAFSSFNPSNPNLNSLPKSTQNEVKKSDEKKPPLNQSKKANEIYTSAEEPISKAKNENQKEKENQKNPLKNQNSEPKVTFFQNQPQNQDNNLFQKDDSPIGNNEGGFLFGNHLIIEEHKKMEDKLYQEKIIEKSKEVDYDGTFDPIDFLEYPDDPKLFGKDIKEILFH